MSVAIAGSGALAATSIWLSQDSVNGTPITGDVTVAPGASIPLYCFMQSSDIGNTFEIMVGYDRSDAATYGAGTGTYQDGKLALLSGQPAIEASISPYFDVLNSAVLLASARENPNTNLGGRPYGFVARGASRTNAVPGGGPSGKIMCFAFTLRNQMTTNGDSQYVVISNAVGGNSYSSAWKYGINLRESSSAVRIVTGQSLPVVGASNKAVLDAIMTTSAPNYIWVFWGKVTVTDANKFTIDDGSGVTINVDAPAHGLSNGNYVAVRGSLNVGTKTLTSQHITKY